MLFVAGAPWRHFAALGALGAVAIALVLVAAAGGRRERPQALPGGPPDVVPAPVRRPGRRRATSRTSRKIAIGSGEKTGRGVENATQTKLDFLPEHHTDFIFAVVGERYGFVGAALVLSLYALLIWRGLRILTMAKNLYGALIAGGIVAMLLFQVFVNVGMNIGIMPITGIPLPLLSYGGSSVLATFLAVGLLQSIYAQARETAARQGPGHRLLNEELIVKKQVLVSVDRGETRVALLEATGERRRHGRQGRRRRKKGEPPAGYRVAELYFERRGNRSIVGNIYKGKVDNVLPGLEAAFVDIGLDKNGFLHVDEIVLPGVETPRRGRGKAGRQEDHRPAQARARRSSSRSSRTR